jgi:hypothetical protein
VSTRIRTREQRIDPPIVRGEHFVWRLWPSPVAELPATFPTSFRFAIGVAGEDPLVEVTQADGANGRIYEPSGDTMLLVTLKTAATRLLIGDREHTYTVYATYADGFEYVWAMGPAMVDFGAGALP